MPPSKRSGSVQSMLKSTSVSFSTTNVCLVWRRVVFFETLIFSKSPSVASHRPPPCCPLLCLFPSSSSPLNFITFGQKGIYSPTKVIAPLMEWACCTIDSLKPCRIFFAHTQCFLFKSSLFFLSLFLCPCSLLSSFVVFKCPNKGCPVHSNLIQYVISFFVCICLRIRSWM